MQVHEGAIGIEIHDGIRGGLVTVRHRGHRLEVRGNLVIGARQGRERDSAPASGHGPVHVTEKYVTDVCLSGQRLRERVGIVELHSIQARNTDVERRMVHENVNRSRAGLGQPLGQPATTPLTVDTCASSFVQGIEEEQPAGRCLQFELDEAVLVARGLRESREEGRTPIVIADHQVIR